MKVLRGTVGSLSITVEPEHFGDATQLPTLPRNGCCEVPGVNV